MKHRKTKAVSIVFGIVLLVATIVASGCALLPTMPTTVSQNSSITTGVTPFEVSASSDDETVVARPMDLSTISLAGAAFGIGNGAVFYGEASMTLELEQTGGPTPTPTVPATPTPTPIPVQIGNGYFDGTYVLRVFTNNQVVTAFIKDINGNYTVPYRNMICSTGLPGMDTPHGTYYPYRIARWLNMVTYGISWEQYVTGISGEYLFHSVPYLEGTRGGAGRHDALSKYGYNQLGRKASHGCIRLQVVDAKWIYDRTQAFVRLEIMGSSSAYPSVPLSLRGSTPYLSSSDYGWDPTDPLSNNPWHSYQPPTPTPTPVPTITTMPTTPKPTTTQPPTPTPIPTTVPTIEPTPTPMPTTQPIEVTDPTVGEPTTPKPTLVRP